jgi:Tol biopolymer transport system component
MRGDGSHVQQLTFGAGFNGQPAWSPDGRMIAFSSSRDGNQEIYRMWIDGTHLRRLSRNIALDYRPAWSPLGNKIAFLSNRDGEGDSEVYTVRPDGTGIRRVTTDALDEQSLSWAPDASRIAFGADGAVYSMKPGGSDQTFLAKGDDPAWSPDGTKIAFSGPCGSSCGDNLFVMDADGGNVNDLTPDNTDGFDGEPDWQPLSR